MKAARSRQMETPMTLTLTTKTLTNKFLLLLERMIDLLFGCRDTVLQNMKVAPSYSQGSRVIESGAWLKIEDPKDWLGA